MISSHVTTNTNVLLQQKGSTMPSLRRNAQTFKKYVDRCTRSISMWCSCGITSALTLPPYLLLRGMRRITITGRERIRALPSHSNLLIIANHPSMIDAFLVTAAIFGVRPLINPFRYFPWQTPDAKNFLWLFPWFRFGKFICIKRNAHGNRHDPGAYRKLLSVLPESSVLIFPEGTRSGNTREVFALTRNGTRIGRPQKGVGALILHSNPTVIPVLIQGAECVLPIGRAMIRPFAAKIRITIGEPFQGGELIPAPNNKRAPKEMYQEVVDAAMHRISILDP